MCGITGWLSTSGPVDRSDLQKMTDALAHRGPDADGVYTHDFVGLGHRRLSVIDTAAISNQPMHDVDGTCTLVFNGEIYNFIELRNRLEGLGQSGRSKGCGCARGG